jgi:PadR family transcriptional regulator, regulatory protein PadR
VRDRGQFDLVLLGIVAQEPGDGYAVASALRAQTGGRIAFSERTVFTSLHRLARNRLVRRKGRVYALTDVGRRSLDAKRREWQTLNDAIQHILDPTT